MIFQHAARGSLRAAIYLADWLCPEFAPKYRDPNQPPRSPVSIVIHGGLPSTIDAGAEPEEEPDC
jgi:hypothetical protein